MLALGLLLAIVGSTMAQPTLTISPNTRVGGTGAVQLVYGGGALTNNSSLSLAAGQFTGPVTYGGTGMATVATVVFNHNTGTSTLNSLLSVTGTATLNANAALNANGQLYIRSDLSASANLINNGLLTGTVQGLITRASATSGSYNYPTTLSVNVSGSVMQYQWQSSSNNSAWTNLPGATGATYTTNVTSSLFYRCLLTTTNTAYSQPTESVSLNTPLPVTLLYFNGRMTEAGALLGWQTAMEVENAHFQIERSRDARSFESIATIPSQATGGNSHLALTYSYLDGKPLAGINYYRLVQTDRNGTQTRSSIIALSRENNPSVLFPNPLTSGGEATIEPAITYTAYQIIDGLGRVVRQTDKPGVLNGVGLGELPAGSYLLRVETTNGPAWLVRMVRP